MNNNLTTASHADPAKTEYADLLADLQRLSRNLLLAFRLEVGQLLLDRFFAGDGRAYASRNPLKEQSFRAFTQACHDDLALLGLGDQTLANCIRARLTWNTLPPGVREQLRFSHVVELTRVGDPTARARLAQYSLQRGWSVDALKGAIEQHKAGNFYDTDPAPPGTQPPRPKELPHKGVAAGRLITRLEKASAGLQAWHADWQGVDAQKLRGAERKRCAAALAALKAQVATLEAQLVLT